MIKKSTIAIVILLVINSGITLKAQTIQDVYNAKTVVFYGYDFTQLKIADPQRIGQPLKKFLPKLYEYLENETPSKKVKSLMKKDTLIYEPLVTELQNENIVNGRIASRKPEVISMDSIQLSVKNYNLKQTNGIGSVISFECFNPVEKTVSLYLVFFDIATRRIISAKRVSSYDANSYNYMNNWKPASSKAVRKCFDDYNDGRKEYLKSQALPKE